jgi:hypothetical protein
VSVFIEHLQIVAASIYRGIANPHNLQFTTAFNNCSQCVVFSPAVAW